jgi:hypothetical protein
MWKNEVAEIDENTVQQIYLVNRFAHDGFAYSWKNYCGNTVFVHRGTSF